MDFFKILRQISGSKIQVSGSQSQIPGPQIQIFDLKIQIPSLLDGEASFS